MDVGATVTSASGSSDVSSSSEAVELKRKKMSTVISAKAAVAVGYTKNRNERIGKPKRSTRFNSNWPRKYQWIEEHPSDSRLARCKVCSTHFLIGSGGEFHIKRHELSAKHKILSTLQSTDISSKNKVDQYFNNVEVNKQTVIAEACFAYHTVMHMHSYLSADCTSTLFAKIFPDSKICKEFSCGRTKIAKIIQRVLKPAAKGIVMNDLSNRCFSIATDASNKGNIKTFPLSVRYFTKEKGICHKLLCFFSSDSEKSKDVAEHLKKQLQVSGLSLKNVTAFCADNASVNFGRHQSIFTELKKENEALIPVGCICHVLHNASKKAVCVLRFDVEYVVIKCYNEFSSSTKNVTSLKDFIEFSKMEWAELLRHTPTRWLSLIPAVERLLKLYEPIKSYFLSKDTSPAYLVKFFTDHLSEAYLSFVLHIGTQLNKTIVLLESNTALALSIPKIIENLINSLKEKLGNQFFGSMTMSILSKCDDLEYVARFKTECSIYIEKIIDYISEKYYYKEIFMELGFMELNEIPTYDDFLKVTNKFSIAGVDKDELFEECVYLKTLLQTPSESTRISQKNIDEKWQYILKAKDLSNIELIVNFILSLPHSNAFSERNFSIMFSIWRKDRNRLDIENVEAELMIKSNFGLSCKEFKTFLEESDVGKNILKQTRGYDKYKKEEDVN